MDLNVKKEKLILVPSDEKYLLGILQGFCYKKSYFLEDLYVDNSDFFLEIFKNKKLRVVFILISQMEKILHSSEWNAIKPVILGKKIALCIIGKPSIALNKVELESIHASFIKNPPSSEEVMNLMSTIESTDNYERRMDDRRKTADRRKEAKEEGKKISISHSFGFPSDYKDENVQNIIINAEGSLSIGKLFIDYSRKAISFSERKINISPKEFQIIDIMMRKADCVIEAEEIIKKVWNKANSGATNADLHQYIYMLRHKLEKDPHDPQLLVTVRGFGYKLCSEILYDKQ